MMIDKYTLDSKPTKKSHDNMPACSYSQYPSLPFVEVLLYYIIWIGGSFWTIFSLVKWSSVNSQKYLNARYLEDGWQKWIGRYQDASDYEWSFWNDHFISVIIVGFAGHFIVARFADSTFPNHRFKIYLLYSTVFTIHYLGIRGLLFMLLHFTLQYSMAVLTKRVLVCWITGCLLVYSLANDTCLSYFKEYYHASEDKMYFLLFATGMCNLRYIAFSIEYVWSYQHNKKIDTSNVPSSTLVEKESTPCEQGDLRHRNIKSTDMYESKKNSPDVLENENKFPLSFFDLLVYQMYYPLFYGGPIINYNEFAKQMKQPPVKWDRNTTGRFTFNVLRHLFWQIFINILLHFIYINAIASDYQLLKKLPLFDLLGMGLSQVLFFYLKYVVMYGLPSHFASSDNLNVLKGPHCVFARHRITDMWKYFDKGLHAWLVRYIFIPCGGSRVNLLRSTINSILPFAFVAFWHGAIRGYLYWGFLSWFGVYMELLALKFYRTAKVQEFESKYCSPQWSRRMRGFLSSFLMSLLLTSNLYFLSGVSVGNLFWHRLYYENQVATILIFSFLYCGCQCSMEFDRMNIYK